MTGYEDDMYNDDGYIYINYKNISVDLGIIIPLDTYIGINLKAGVRYVNYNNINFDHKISKLNLDQFTTGNLKNKYSKATTYFFSIGIVGASFIKKHSPNDTNI